MSPLMGTSRTREEGEEVPMANYFLPPADDVSVAAHLNRSFKVTWRQQKGERWLDLEVEIDSLARALEVAQSASRPCTAVWMERPSRNGYAMYWTSASPEVMNSTILTQENVAATGVTATGPPSRGG
jgi:hypothetical protein